MPRRVVYPSSGTLRVSPAPALLPSRRRLGEPGLNRFDDPDGWYVVRYTASTLRGCLIELLARFRDRATAEARIEGVTGLDVEEEPRFARSLASEIGDWLALQRVGVCHLEDPNAEVLSVNDAKLLADLNNHPRVRAALEASGLGSSERPAELDGATVRLPGAVGRSITQALSRALYDREPRPAALAYASRLDDDETCWAVFGHTPVRFEPEPRLLDPRDAGHRHAVNAAADLYGLPLPDAWR